MNLNRLIFFVFLLSAGLLNAQTDFRPGYIVENSGDTIFGYIDYRGDLLMSSICRFKDTDNTIKVFSPYEIMAYRFIDSKLFVSRKVNDKNVFLEYLIKGKINIYFMRDASGGHYYIDKENVELTEIPYEERIIYLYEVPFNHKSSKHIGVLSYLMQDAPEFKSRIESITKPDHQNLIKLAEDYHNTVCKDEECVIYQKSVPLIKILPEF